MLSYQWQPHEQQAQACLPVCQGCCPAGSVATNTNRPCPLGLEGMALPGCQAVLARPSGCDLLVLYTRDDPQCVAKGQPETDHGAACRDTWCIVLSLRLGQSYYSQNGQCRMFATGHGMSDESAFCGLHWNVRHSHCYMVQADELA